MDKRLVKSCYMHLKHLVSERAAFQKQLNTWTKLLRATILARPTSRAQKNDSSASLMRISLKFLKSSVFTFCVVNTVITVVGYPACIFGKSMQPEFNSPTQWQTRDPPLLYRAPSLLRLDVDWVWVSCWKARDYQFSRGDIVVFVSPKEPHDYVIKRVIGLEGDTVTSHQHSPIKVKIPEGHCWVEGDNWNNSVDSNKYGPIPKGLIFGVATHVIWPTHKWRRLVHGIPSRLDPGRVEAHSQTKPRSDQGRLYRQLAT